MLTRLTEKVCSISLTDRGEIMANKRIAGITVEIGADATEVGKLLKALKNKEKTLKTNCVR